MTEAPDPYPGASLPPASERQGVPGHDQALDRANAIRLLTLRANGLTYEQIAEQVGYADASGARQALLRALDRHEAEGAHQLRTLENLRLDADERILRALAGDPNQSTGDRIRAINARVRLSARRARLNGLDAPVQVAITTGATAEMEDALALLREAVEAQTVPGEVVHRELGPDADPHPGRESSPDRVD